MRINAESFPGRVLQIGEVGNNVVTLQKYLNRVSQNYPAIPKITPVDGVFSKNTEDAVKAFQRIFNLTPDGLVGKATWYRLTYLYTAVKRLAELNSEGVKYEDIALQFPETIGPGDSGPEVQIIQYYLAVIGNFISQIPVVAVDGIYGTETRDAIYAFQAYAGLPLDGIVGRQTWNKLFETYIGIIDTIPINYFGNQVSRKSFNTRIFRRSSGNYAKIFKHHCQSIYQHTDSDSDRIFRLRNQAGSHCLSTYIRYSADRRGSRADLE